MKKIKSFGRWLVLNSAIGALVYAVLFTDYGSNAGLVRIALVLLWGWSFISWFLMMMAASVLAKVQPGQKFKFAAPDLDETPRWLSHAYDAAVTLALVYAGWNWTAAVYALHVPAQMITIGLLREALKKANPETK